MTTPGGAGGPRDGRERGTVSVVLVAVVGVVVVLTGVVGQIGAVAVARHRAAAAADLAALAAVDGGCELGRAVARENGGRLTTCTRGENGSVVVAARVSPPGVAGRLTGPAEVSARAGFPTGVEP